MLISLLYVRTAWNDHFPANTTTNYNLQTYISRQTPSDSNVYISNCIFRSITSTSDGGALYCTSVTYFLVESSSFLSCKTSAQNGGAIYFTNSSAQSVLYEVCGYDCCSSSYYFFAYLRVNDASSSKNYVNYSSISRYVSEDSGSRNMFRLYNGKQCCPSVNMSMNKCYYRSGIFCTPFLDPNSFTCSISYSSFADNINDGYNCIVFDTNDAKYEMKSCNVLRNTQPLGNGEGTIRSDGILVIEDSCILENKAKYIFYQYYSCTITLSSSTVDSTSNNGYLTIQNIVAKSFILALNHLATQNCHSEYDSAGTLTPIIQTSSSSKKQVYCYTRENAFYHPQLTLASTFIFIFNFIHPGASNDP
jgi:hypothetical protein